MKNSLYILIVFLLIILNVNAQDNDTELKWFKNTPIKIETSENGQESEKEDFGELRIVGWSENGFVSYIFSPMSVLACEWEEYFYIYNFIDNKMVWEKFACSVDWNDRRNKTVSECIKKLNEYNLVPADQPMIYPINAESYDNDTFITVYKLNDLLKSIYKDNSTRKILQPVGYIKPPLTQNRKILLFPVESDIEEFLIYGVKSE